MQTQIISLKTLGIALAAVFVMGGVALMPSMTHAADSTYSYSYSVPASTNNSTYSYSYSVPKTTTTKKSTYSYSYSVPKTTTPTYSYSYSVPQTSTYSYSYSVPTYTTPTYTTPGGCTSNCGGTYVPPTPTCSIWVSKTSIVKGEAVTVSWNASNSISGNISNIGTNLPTVGSYTIYPQDNLTFTGTFKNSYNQTATCVANVVVTNPQCPANHTGTYPNCVPIQCPAGYTGSYPNCVPPQYCPSGYTGTYPNCVPPPSYNNPSCSITINNYGNNYNNGYWQPNSAVSISWNSSNANYGYINNNFGAVGLSGSRTVYPTQTTTYTGTFYGYNGQSVTCSATVYVNGYVPPVNPGTPYVTLAAVPYTGLELGPVGTALYWGFLVFWCVLAAYLIAVKRVQNHVYAALVGFLFGKKASASHTVSHSHVSYTTPVVRVEDKTDDFILSQINRVRA